MNTYRRPETYLPTAEQLADLKHVQDTDKTVVIAEIAGRDSVAAMAAYAPGHPDVVFLPTMVSTPTEYGDYDAPFKAIEYTRSIMPDTRILDAEWLYSPVLWRALNARYAQELISRYPSWSPCAACHLYVHLMRAPLAFALGGVPILTGERNTHDGRYKLSQTPLGIEATIDTFAEFGIEFIEPIQDVHDGLRIAELVGTDWDEGARQLECAHSGSFGDVDGYFAYEPEVWRRYLDEFAIPAMRAVLTKMRAGEFDADWIALIGDVVRKLP